MIGRPESREECPRRAVSPLSRAEVGSPGLRLTKSDTLRPDVRLANACPRTLRGAKALLGGAVRMHRMGILVFIAPPASVGCVLSYTRSSMVERTRQTTVCCHRISGGRGTAGALYIDAGSTPLFSHRWGVHATMIRRKTKSVAPPNAAHLLRGAAKGAWAPGRTGPGADGVG